MATRYIEILAVQRPFPIGSDDSNRALFSFNFDALADSPVSQWEEGIAEILSTARLSTLNVDTFIGPLSVLPTGNGPYISIIDTGGREPLETHDGIKCERLSVQILVR